MAAKNWLIFRNMPGPGSEVYQIAANSKQQAINLAKQLAEDPRGKKTSWFVYELVGGVEAKVQVDLVDVDIVEPHEVVEEELQVVQNMAAAGNLFNVEAAPRPRR